MAHRNSQFKAGYGVYNCTMCGRSTRGDADSGDMCGQCDELTGSDNYHNDNGVVPSEDDLNYYNGLLGKITAKGGDAAKVRDFCGYIWRK